MSRKIRTVSNDTLQKLPELIKQGFVFPMLCHTIKPNCETFIELGKHHKLLRVYYKPRMSRKEVRQIVKVVLHTDGWQNHQYGTKIENHIITFKGV